MTQTFKVTSEVPYDRHDYEILLKNNKKVFLTIGKTLWGIGS